MTEAKKYIKMYAPFAAMAFIVLQRKDFHFDLFIVPALPNRLAAFLRFLPQTIQTVDRL